MVHDTAYITERGTQNLDTPDLPFAQSYPIHTEADIPINFAQSRREEYFDYIVNGDHWTFGTMVDKKVRWTESNAQQYREKGYSVVKVQGTGGTSIPKTPTPTIIDPVATGTSTPIRNVYTRTGYRPHVLWTKPQIETILKDYFADDIARLYTIHAEQEKRITAKASGGFTKPQIETILKDYYSDDILRLDRIHKEQEGRITDAYKHRLSIEDKVNKAKAEHQNIWDSIGQKSDISHIHLGNGNENDNGNGGDWCNCGLWDIGCKWNCLIKEQGGNVLGGSLMTIAIIGIGAYFVLRRKRR